MMTYGETLMRLNGRQHAPRMLTAAAFFVMASGAAMAQSEGGYDPFAEFSAQDQAVYGEAAPGYEVAPGYDRPDFDATPSEREVITVFEEPPLSAEPDALSNPINVFAGKTHRYDNGVFGAILPR